MNVLMIGWEYPPHIAGGLGTACQGLTKALARRNVDITFVVPQLYGDEDAGHMSIIDLSSALPAFAAKVRLPEHVGAQFAALKERVQVPAFLMPYWTEQEFLERLAETEPAAATALLAEAGVAELEAPGAVATGSAPKSLERYGNDIYEQVAIFTERVTAQALRRDFDVIHAHDWMTYPAGVAIQQITGKPLVVHVHSLESDRSGLHVNQRIRDIEGYGVTQADRVVAVSHYTKSVIHREHAVPLDRICVVHNGIYKKQALRHYRERRPAVAKHVVLFLGRVTFQKGPDYFVRAAAKVVPHVPDVLFVMAGSGDMLEPMKRLVIDLGIEEHFEFPGFVSGVNVEEMYSIADLYVMPSVSEPFGITALEAINFEAPTLMSRQSGASEVIANTLKFDFWDVDRLADLMINGLLHEELRSEMKSMARRELKHLRWDASAAKTLDVYRQVLAERGTP